MLRSGYISITVSNGQFTFEGTDLIYDFVDYEDNSANEEITITVGSVTGDGPAFLTPNEPPPTN